MTHTKTTTKTTTTTQTKTTTTTQTKTITKKHQPWTKRGPLEIEFDLDLDSNYDSIGEFEQPKLEQPEQHEYHLEGNVYL